MFFCCAHWGFERTVGGISRQWWTEKGRKRIRMTGEILCSQTHNTESPFRTFFLNAGRTKCLRSGWTSPVLIALPPYYVIWLECISPFGVANKQPFHDLRSPPLRVPDDCLGTTEKSSLVLEQCTMHNIARELHALFLFFSIVSVWLCCSSSMITVSSYSISSFNLPPHSSSAD